MPEEEMTTAEAAKFLRLSANRTRELVRQGELPAQKKGNRYTFRFREVKSFENSYRWRRKFPETAQRAMIRAIGEIVTDVLGDQAEAELIVNAKATGVFGDAPVWGQIVIVTPHKKVSLGELRRASTRITNEVTYRDRHYRHSISHVTFDIAVKFVVCGYPRRNPGGTVSLCDFEAGHAGDHHFPFLMDGTSEGYCPNCGDMSVVAWATRLQCSCFNPGDPKRKPTCGWKAKRTRKLDIEVSRPPVGPVKRCRDLLQLVNPQ